MLMQRSKQQFVKAPNGLVFDTRLRSQVLRVYLALRSYRNERTLSKVFPSRSTIANRLNCSVDTVDRAIKILEKLGYIEHVRGGSGRANSYHFLDPPTLKNGRMDAAMSAAQMQSHTRNSTLDITAQMRPQPERVNQNKYPDYPTLYHGRDRCFVKEDGAIRIHTKSNGWVDYSGGDDERFSYGKLLGFAAKQSAINHSKKIYG